MKGLTRINPGAANQRYTRSMTRQLSLSLLFLLLIVTPVLPGWMAVAHQAEPAAVMQPEDSSTHQTHAANASAADAGSDCAMQMDAACLQLCVFCALPADISVASLLCRGSYTGANVPAPDTPYLALPFQPPRY